MCIAAAWKKRYVSGQINEKIKPIALSIVAVHLVGGISQHHDKNRKKISQKLFGRIKGSSEGINGLAPMPDQYSQAKIKTGF